MMSGELAAGTLLLRELTSSGRKRLGTQGLQATAGAPELSEELVLSIFYCRQAYQAWDGNGGLSGQETRVIILIDPHVLGEEGQCCHLCPFPAGTLGKCKEVGDDHPSLKLVIQQF